MQEVNLKTFFHFAFGFDVKTHKMDFFQLGEKIFSARVEHWI